MEEHSLRLPPSILAEVRAVGRDNEWKQGTVAGRRKGEVVVAYDIGGE